jgi:four helix bundle protein
MESFYDLLIYQRSYKAALAIHKLSKSFPKDEQFSLTSQIRRASKSIPSNIAEGYAKRHSSENEFKRFLQIAIGSTNEMLVWLDFCHDLTYMKKEEAEALKCEYIEISKMIYGLSKNWKNKAA